MFCNIELTGYRVIDHLLSQTGVCRLLFLRQNFRQQQIQGEDLRDLGISAKDLS